MHHIVSPGLHHVGIIPADYYSIVLSKNLNRLFLWNNLWALKIWKLSIFSLFFSVQLLAWQAALRAKIQNHYSANQKLTNIHII